MMILLGSTLKVSALILAGLAGAAAARRHSAAARHWVIAASLLCALAIPALERYVPSWTIPTASTLQDVGDGSPLSTGAVSAGSATVEFNEAVAVASAPSSRTVARTVWLLWAGGFAFCILVLTVGLLRLAWIAAHAQAVIDGPWPRLMTRHRPRARHPLTGAIARELSSVPARDLGLRPAQGHHPSRRAHLVRRSHCRRAETRTGARPPRRLAHPDRRRTAARDLLVQPADLDRLRPPSRRERACLRRRSLDERHRSAHLRHASC